MTRATFLATTMTVLLLGACGGETPPNEPEVVTPSEPVDDGLPQPSAYEPEDAPAAPFALLEIFTSEG